MIGPFSALRRAMYGRGIMSSVSLPRPVISIGNLSAGGSGKTPHVQHIASWMSGLGLKVAVLSRGYGRRSKGVIWVSRGDGPLVSATVGGDEPVLLAGTLPGVAVLVGESRAQAGIECLRSRETDVFLLDDGFQHLSLRRDADILLVDAAQGLGNRRSLPFGPLREPAGSARFADALVLTRCAGLSQGEAVAATVPFPAGRPRAFSRLAPRSLVDRGGAEIPLPSPGAEAVAFCGLARNDQFLATLRESGFAVRRFLGYGDHHWYLPAELGEIASAADGGLVLTTEKDLARLPDDVPFDVKALRVRVEFLEGWETLSGLLLERIRSAVRR
ncbi:MAG: tetraacyldisaccharide 4'-kinase [Deltaproteobacteria bacterium]